MLRHLSKWIVPCFMVVFLSSPALAALSYGTWTSTLHLDGTRDIPIGTWIETYSSGEAPSWIGSPGSKISSASSGNIILSWSEPVQTRTAFSMETSPHNPGEPYYIQYHQTNSPGLLSFTFWDGLASTVYTVDIPVQTSTVQSNYDSSGNYVNTIPIPASGIGTFIGEINESPGDYLFFTAKMSIGWYDQGPPFSHGGNITDITATISPNVPIPGALWLLGSGLLGLLGIRRRLG